DGLQSTNDVLALRHGRPPFVVEDAIVKRRARSQKPMEWAKWPANEATLGPAAWDGLHCRRRDPLAKL
ncbi:MAG TPA: hypothetical protein VNN12_04135, partial [Dehalococcoidia bacterium]|nr:hypothetical protein [Dehalococcoidia bacterium]